jgi:Ca2+-binding EF-hand superfamily protein
MASSQSQFGPVWKQKIRTLQARLDLNGDGIMNKEDFVEIVQRFETVAQATARQVEKLQDVLTKFWNANMAEKAAAEGGITADAYVAMLEAMGKKAISKTANEGYTPLFDAIDANNDGHISLEEYTIYYKILDLSPSYAEESFNVIDSDHDGFISRAEFMLAADDFFTSENGSNFFGPAVEKEPIQSLKAKSQEVLL